VQLSAIITAKLGSCGDETVSNTIETIVGSRTTREASRGSCDNYGSYDQNTIGVLAPSNIKANYQNILQSSACILKTPQFKPDNDLQAKVDDAFASRRHRFTCRATV
jgi:hypothetical protein